VPTQKQSCPPSQPGQTDTHVALHNAAGDASINQCYISSNAIHRGSMPAIH
jgi:hypothetical protein